MIVIIHPCFDVVPKKEGNKRIYEWDRSYFNEDVTVNTWGKFPTPFTQIHRPLCVYWKEFKEVGFKCMDFDEPRWFAKSCGYEIPVSFVFHLQK